MADILSPRGVRDFEPKEKFVRDEVVGKLKKVFQKYGFLPLETSMIERTEILTAKFAGGDTADVSKEIFSFKDQGKRDLGLRFDLTVPLARYVAQNPRIKMPFKRYEIGRVYRDGPIKLGRYREFWQCDVDIVGCENTNADVECLNLGLAGFKELGLDAYIEFNSRKLLDGVLEISGIDKKKWSNAIISIDKLKKIGSEGVEKELLGIGIKKDQSKKLLSMLNSKNDIDYFEKELKQSEIGTVGVNDVNEVLLLAEDKKRVKFVPSLARGLAYYTGIVFEGFLSDGKIKSSICGGGRYDNMIGMFMGQNKTVSAVGISFGLEPITEYLKLNRKEEVLSTTKLFIIPINTFKECSKLASFFRKEGVNTEVDIMGRGISKNMNYANSLNIPFVLIVGEDELKSKKLTLKDMKSGKEQKLDKEKIAEILKD